MTVVFREEALADLEELARYIAHHNPDAAARVITRIHRGTYRTIDRLPLSGRLNRTNGTREFAGPGLPYLSIYLPVGDLVDVIFHTSRDPAHKR